MSIDIVLKNLTDYVDLGVSLLKSNSEKDLYSLLRDNSLINILDYYDLSDIVGCITDIYLTSDILDYLHEDEIAQWSAQNVLSEVIGYSSNRDLLDCIKENYDAEDLIDISWRY